MAKKFHGGGQANMPSELVMKAYPKASQGAPEDYRDSLESIDMISKDCHKKMMKQKGGRFSKSGNSY